METQELLEKKALRNVRALVDRLEGREREAPEEGRARRDCELRHWGTKLNEFRASAVQRGISARELDARLKEETRVLKAQAKQACAAAAGLIRDTRGAR